MSLKSFFRLDLRRLILLLAFTTAAVTLVNGLYASHKVQRQLLLDQTLNNNAVYASKLAASTNNFLLSAQQQLAYAAGEISTRMDDDALLFHAAERLRLQTDSFNSVAVLDPKGMVLATSPDTLQLKGQQLVSQAVQTALEQQRPMISEPFVSAANNLLVLISHPIVDETGRYLGFIAGSIYLDQRSILNDLLGTHYYNDGSYLYVVDQQRRLLYHPDTSRAAERVNHNPVIEAVIQGQSGQQLVNNSENVPMLAGYAPIEAAGWGVVAQRPVDATLQPLNQLMRTVVDHTLPLALITLGLIWWLARLISRPLWQLADNARRMDTDCSPGRIQQIHSWYFESSQIKQAMLLGVGLLHTRMGQLKDDSRTDPLTGLQNRRSLERYLNMLELEQTPFSVLALDIDHFKRVNDSHGHDAGDEVLQEMARIMREGTRQGDMVCRTGGEEFIVILPHTDAYTANTLAERLRQEISTADIPHVGHITTSIGIAAWPEQADEPAQVLKYADKALYRAKENGRNQCLLYEADAVTTG
ncbi:sensor domain-containing diguanylate cyclase [Marinobacterium weihaiense]|uniref:diguanylate cyclase n=1 Tax=Marinobacterium weihaiense TaxID=2851016 RepID=A0ABS6MBE0_9GAMM|nr:sensor domain-containing diguanylate cyclase [Marinobacterium weihaiense]MBV0933590.1 sensor domain-containing diguanylate cyclase [Marinobacterium weihaiense]